MMNYEKLNESYTLLSDALFDACIQMDESGTYEEIEEYISIIDKFSIILDRLGKTIVLEEGQERVEQEGVSEEIVVKKGGEK